MKKILVVNALNGAFAIALRKKYPDAEITCAEYFPYHIGHLNRLGFQTVMWDQMDKDMKFDIVVGNPPYQETGSDGRKDQASNLWSKFWSWVLSLTADDGKAVLVTPTSWLSPSADLKAEYKIDGKDRLWDVFNQYSSYADVTNVADHFPGIGSTFGYVVVDKSGKDGLRFSDGADTSLGFLPKSEPELVMKLLSATNNLGKQFKIDQVNSKDIRVSVPMTRVLNESSIQILTGEEEPTTGSSKPDLYLYVHVPSEAVAKRVSESILRCLDVLNTHCRYSGFLNIKILKMIKFE